MAAHEVRMVRITDLKRAEYNPDKRVKDIKRLTQSIEEIGLQYPILVTKKNEVVDGHRRLAACEELGWDEVPVIVTNTDRQRAYADVNSTARFMSSNDVLSIFFVNPEALTDRVREKITKACEEIGVPTVKMIQRKGFSLRLYRVAKKAADYCDQTDPKFLKAAVRWAMENGSSNLETAVITRTKASVIINAIKTGKELKVSFGT